jgi:cytochrome P450
VYNIFFHPLRHYPGPLLWRASPIPKNWHFIMGTYHRKAYEMHQKYHGTVRVAPDCLSYVDPGAWKDIIGRPYKTELAKDSRFFGGETLGANMLSAAPPDHHARMRRLFAPAFTNTALKAQEPLLQKYADQMIAKMQDMQTRFGRVNLVDLYAFTTFDIMGDLIFGQPLMLLERGDYTPWVKAVHLGLKFILWHGVLTQIPIVGAAITALTASAMKKGSQEHNEYAADLVDRRLAHGSGDKPDVWSFVLKHDGDEKGLKQAEMRDNASMFTIAGSETSATALPGTTAFVLNHPKVQQRLVEEIRTSFPAAADMSTTALMELPYLNAVIKEGLRLYLAGAAVMPRIVPPGGTEICGEHIPGGVSLTCRKKDGLVTDMMQTTVWIDAWVANRLDRFWARPLEFLPERWLNPDDPEFAKDDKSIFRPFWAGPRDCLGKK